MVYGKWNTAKCRQVLNCGCCWCTRYIAASIAVAVGPQFGTRGGSILPLFYHYCLLLGREFGSCCMQMEHSVHDVFLVNETDLWEGHGLLQIPFKLCNAQPQFLWYGLLSTSMSFNEILASKTPPNIIWNAPLAILSSLPSS